MKISYATNWIRASFIIISAVTFVLCPAASLKAQQAGQAGSPVVSPNAGLRDREWALTHIPEEVNKKFAREQVSFFKQINEDFKRIQVLNNELMSAVSSGRALNYKLISDNTAEIKRRANRLKLYLILPKLEDEKGGRPEQRATDTEQLKANLILLDEAVMSFVTNPLFQQPNVINVDLSSKASRSLKTIIDLSSLLKKSAEQLQKN